MVRCKIGRQVILRIESGESGMTGFAASTRGNDSAQILIAAFDKRGRVRVVVAARADVHRRKSGSFFGDDSAMTDTAHHVHFNMLLVRKDQPAIFYLEDGRAQVCVFIQRPVAANIGFFVTVRAHRGRGQEIVSGRFTSRRAMAGGAFGQILVSFV